MAENKKSFILYADLIHTVEKLPDHKAGKLLKLILGYVNDKNPKTDDLILQVAFEPIKQQLKRDLKEWEDEKISRSEAGKKGMANRWKDHVKITKDNKNNTVINQITNITDNVTVTVNDTATSISRNQVIEYLTGASPSDITKSVIEDEADKLIKEFGGKKIGNLRALCNRWMTNYLLAPVIEGPKKPKIYL